MTNIIEITEDRKIVCAVCGYTIEHQTLEDTIDEITTHYLDTHKEVGDSLSELRDSIIRLSPSEKRLGTGHFKRCD